MREAQRVWQAGRAGRGRATHALDGRGGPAGAVRPPYVMVRGFFGVFAIRRAFRPRRWMRVASAAGRYARSSAMASSRGKSSTRRSCLRAACRSAAPFGSSRATARRAARRSSVVFCRAALGRTRSPPSWNPTPGPDPADLPTLVAASSPNPATAPTHRPPPNPTTEQKQRRRQTRQLNMPTDQP